MNQKYEISEIAHPQYPWLHRIRALSDVRPGVPKDMYSARKISVRKAPVGLQMMLLCVTMLGYMGRPGLVTKAIYRVRQ